MLRSALGKFHTAYTIRAIVSYPSHQPWFSERRFGLRSASQLPVGDDNAIIRRIVHASRRWNSGKLYPAADENEKVHHDGS